MPSRVVNDSDDEKSSRPNTKVPIVVSNQSIPVANSVESNKKALIDERSGSDKKGSEGHASSSYVRSSSSKTDGKPSKPKHNVKKRRKKVGNKQSREKRKRRLAAIEAERLAEIEASIFFSKGDLRNSLRNGFIPTENFDGEHDQLHKGGQKRSEAWPPMPESGSPSM